MQNMMSENIKCGEGNKNVNINLMAHTHTHVYVNTNQKSMIDTITKKEKGIQIKQ